MAAQLQGLLIRTGLAASLLLAGCAGPPAVARPDAAPAQAAAPVAPDGPPVQVVAPQVVPPPAFGPGILLPDAGAADEVVVKIGDLELRKSHAYTRLLSADPKLALSAVDLLVFDVLVARHAQEHGITVRQDRIEELAAAEEQELGKQVQSEFGASMSVADYVWRIFGMRLPDWRASVRLRTAQRLYQGYVIRYLGAREDRVQVRYIVHKDKKVVDEIADKVRAGADFATLALRWSEDNYRRDGGLLPWFGRGFPHPAAETAFALKKGEVSAPFSARVGDVERWFVVFCLDRVVGRTVSFEQVRDEIDRELQTQPIAPIEMSAYTLRWRAAFERTESAPRGEDR